MGCIVCDFRWLAVLWGSAGILGQGGGRIKNEFKALGNVRLKFNFESLGLGLKNVKFHFKIRHLDYFFEKVNSILTPD